MLRRALAVIFAACVLSAALVVRYNRPEGGDGSTNEAAGDARAAAGDGKAEGSSPANTDVDVYDLFADSGAELLCIEELALVCEESFSLMGFEVRVEPVWTTVDRMADGGALGADVWVTVRPFDRLGGAPSGGRIVLGPPSRVVASTPIVLTAPAPAIDALDGACPDAAVLFTCATDQARARNVVLRDPGRSAHGALAAAAVAHDLGVRRSDAAVADAAAADHLRHLLRTARRSQSPLQDAIRIGRASVALTVEADLIASMQDLEFEELTRYDEVGVRYPLDVGPVEVVVLTVPAFPRGDELATLLASRDVAHAFRRAGYMTPGPASSIVEYAKVFEGRPAIRTDLVEQPEFMTEMRRLGAP